jgi:hypothetical protein
MKTTILSLAAVMVLACNSHALRGQDAGSPPQSQSNPATCLTATDARSADDPMVGNWRLNPQKSRLVDEMKITSLGGNKYSLDFGGGPPETIVADGTDQPGNFGTTNSTTIVSPDEWRGERKKNGKVQIVGIWTLSKDGKRLHDDFTYFPDNGKTVHLVYVYERRGTGSGFAGDWVSTTAQVDTVYVVQVKSFGGDGLSIFSSAEGTTKNIKFDGKDYSNTGSGVTIVSSAQRRGERTIALTDKIGGKVVDTQEISVSADSNTLTMTIHVPDRSDPNVFVFEGSKPRTITVNSEVVEGLHVCN